MAEKKRMNPCYALVIPVGTAFVVTAFAYGLMAFQMMGTIDGGADRHANHPLVAWLRVHGSTTLFVELALLAILTVGAIATDGWWTKSAATRKDNPDDA